MASCCFVRDGIHLEFYVDGTHVGTKTSRFISVTISNLIIGIIMVKLDIGNATTLMDYL